MNRPNTRQGPRSGGLKATRTRQPFPSQQQHPSPHQQQHPGHQQPQYTNPQYQPRPYNPAMNQAAPTPLFDDTSSPYTPHPGAGPPPSGIEGYGGFDIQSIPGSELLSEPLANAAMQYGTTLASHGKDIVDKNIDRFISVSKLKYYFAVDTAYVLRKLLILIFPFHHQDWAVRYSSQDDQPVAPRYDINAPDLYIPVMAFVTYILAVGFATGIQNRFTPEQLGIQASSALAWYIFEVALIILTLYIVNIKTSLGKYDLLAFCGYKYFGMILCLILGLFSNLGYYIALCWTSCCIVFFLVRTLRLVILPDGPSHSAGGKRRIYVLLFIAVVQPMLMYWLTFVVLHSP